VAVVAAGGGRGGGPGGNPRGERDAEGRTQYSVVRTGDEIRVVSPDEIEKLAATVREENTKARDDWERAKKEARKAGTDFDEPKPKPKPFQVLAKSVTGRRDAEELRLKYEQKLLASMKGKYAVVGVDREYRVVAKQAIGKLRSEIDADFRKEMEKFRESRRGGDDGGGRGGARPPRKPTLRILPKAFATEADAHAYIAELSKQPRGEGADDLRRRPEGGGRADGRGDDRGDGRGRGRGGSRGGDA